MKIERLPTIEQISRCETSPWDFGNKVLYDLCKENFKHDDTKKILAKVWIIGRSYSAAIERRRNKELINDNFYINSVAPAFKNSEIDKHLNILKKYNKLNLDNLPLVLEAHHYLTKLTASITNLEKRSFSSKYLHFHLPGLFVIYDSRVVNSLRYFIDRVPDSMSRYIQSNKCDKEYAKFACKCLRIIDLIKEKYNIALSVRQFDNLLIELSNNKITKDFKF